VKKVIFFLFRHCGGAKQFKITTRHAELVSASPTYNALNKGIAGQARNDGIGFSGLLRHVVPRNDVVGCILNKRKAIFRPILRILGQCLHFFYKKTLL